MEKKKSINWGIIGCGKIAAHFATDLALLQHNNLYAVASRAAEKAGAFAKKHNATHYYGSYEELCQDPIVDIVYVATPHDSHLKYGRLVLESGKHLLCEKPLAVNSSQVKELIDIAQAKGLFMMEALWSRFNPSIEAVLQRVQQGDIGTVNYINADFCFYKDFDPDSRLFCPLRAGGALLDIGIYPLFLSYLLLGSPYELVARSILHDNGIDLQTSMVLRYHNASAVLNCGLISTSDMTAKINGSKGSLHIHDRWHEAQCYSIVMDKQETKYEMPTLGRGYSYEILECAKCIGEGSQESPKWSHADSMNLMAMMDEVRRQVGVKYPFEQ